MHDIGPCLWYRSRKALTARLFRPPWVSVSILVTVSGHNIPWARLRQRVSSMTLELQEDNEDSPTSPFSSSSKIGPTM
jgi:hypothetical protein